MADEAYSSALSWIFRKHRAGEKRAEDEACGGRAHLVRKETRAGGLG